jgi:Na+/melibiose symporter-like transporter
MLEPTPEPIQATPLQRLLQAPTKAAASLWNAPLPNARFLIVSGSFWTVNLAITEPYRFLFFSRLGLSPDDIGKLFAADLVIRSVGLLLSSTTQRAFGAKRMLVFADIVSWALPYLILGFATKPWHAILAVLLTSLNAFASTPYNCMIAEGMPAERRTKAYAFLYLWNMAPALLVPWFAGWLVSSHPFGPTLRVLFLIQACCMGIGIYWRATRLVDLHPSATSSDIGMLGTFRRILLTPGFLPAWAALATQGVFSNLSNAFLAIYLSKHLRLSDTLPAWIAEVSTIGFAIGTLAIQPRLSESQVPRFAAMALGVHALVTAAFFLHPNQTAVLVIALVGGLCSALYGAATSSILTTSLPANARDHGFALSYVGVHLAGALCMPLAGKILDVHLAWFPGLVIGSLLLWAASIGLTRTHGHLTKSDWKPDDAVTSVN